VIFVCEDEELAKAGREENLEVIKKRINHRKRNYQASLVLVLERVASAIFRADMTNISMRFVKYRDKTFSFTDCSSFALMERIGITEVFAFDSISRNTEVLSYYPLNREFKSGFKSGV